MEQYEPGLITAMGLDLGTCNSCAGIYRYKEAKVEIISNEFGNKTTPSYVAFTNETR